MATYVPLTVIYDALKKQIPAAYPIDRAEIAIQIKTELEKFYAKVDQDMRDRETELSQRSKQG